MEDCPGIDNFSSLIKGGYMDTKFLIELRDYVNGGEKPDDQSNDRYVELINIVMGLREICKGKLNKILSDELTSEEDVTALEGGARRRTRRRRQRKHHMKRKSNKKHRKSRGKKKTYA
jgi:hypothetical protein